MAVLSGQARADIKDYEFQIIDTELKQGDAVLAVRLVDKRNGKPVPDAVVFATRIDMAPDGMEGMTSKIEPAPAAEPGTYRFNVKLTMAGNWRLSLAAKVQGETGTVENRLTFKAVK
nr:FixH family protein [Enterovirga sp. DB1703]